MCREEIELGARKCIHCDSYQGKINIFNLSPIVLSMLVALVSVSTAALPPLIQAFSPKSRLVVSFQGSSNAAVLSLVTNLGSKPASIIQQTLVYQRNGIRQSSPMAILGDVMPGGPKIGDFAGVLVMPGQSRLIHAALLPASIGPGQPDTAKDRCSINFAYIGFNNITQYGQAPFDCLLVIPAVNGSLKRRIKIPVYNARGVLIEPATKDQTR